MSAQLNGGASSNGTQLTHPSRENNHSVSSVRSDRGERSSRSRTPAVESAVTRLLVSIKQLLESLTKWSTEALSEEDVSDVYVRLGNDFNAAVAAFASYNIDMTELLSVPEDLRAVLEDCLSEEPSGANLDKYLPNVRSIITNLLHGLRSRQSTFRKIVSTSRHGSDASGHSRTDSRVSRGDRSSRRDTRSSAVDENATARRNTQTSVASSSSRRRENAATSGDDQFVGGFSPQITQPMPSSGPSNNSGLPDRTSSSTRVRTPASQTPPPPDAESAPTPVASSRASQVPVPASVKRYSLVDKPMQAPPPVVVDEASPDPSLGQSSSASTLDRDSTSPTPEQPLLPLSNPGVASSLAALKQSDALERRASKRFSTYNISKMTGVQRAGSGSHHPNRRSLAAGGMLTAGELAALTEADEEPGSGAAARVRDRSRSATRSRGPSPLQEVSEGQPPVPPLPPVKSEQLAATPAGAGADKQQQQPHAQSTPSTAPQPATAHAPAEPPAPQGAPGPITVFMQVGREVKKAKMEPGQSFSSLRVLFVEKFAYNPGQGNFPAIYIRDPSSGVQYELEDMDELKENCLLSLNIEPLDQIKEHIDSQILGLAQELRDLKKAVGDSVRRSSVVAPPTFAEPATAAPIPRPTDTQFRTVARRLSRLVGDSQIPPQSTGAPAAALTPQYTGMSTMSEASGRIVADLKTQFDEVQNLRRDLGIMRQLYTEFARQTKAALGGLRAQTARVREMASSQVPGARAYIDEGKSRLDARSQNVLTRMEELQDTVEQVKDDVLKRQISPKPTALRALRGDVAGIADELGSLREYIKTVKPMWKKTWEEELQSIVEEQQFLNHQEEFLTDLLEDHKAVVEVIGHVEKVISIRGAAGARGSRGRGFKPPPLDEGHNGLSTVMLEIQGAPVDQERRMKAIAANQKSRERELRARGDAFESELQVGQRNLRMTGGAEEAERVRQRRNDMTLRAMFSPSASASAPGALVSPPGSAPLSPSSEKAMG